MAGDGSNHWAMVHIQDLARAYVIAAEKALRILGWSPRQPNFIDGIQRYYQAWKTAKA